MPDSIKHARVETSDERRPVRRDPRAEPDSDVPEVGDKGDRSPQRLDVTGIGPHSPSVRTPPESVTRTSAVPRIESIPGDLLARRSAAPRIEPIPIADENAVLLGRRATDPGHTPDAAGASGIAVLRRQLATLQLSLSDTQAQRAREQEERALDAEEIARVVSLLSSAEAENKTLLVDLERERAFVEELRVSVREKYEDCNVLRQRLADAESLVAKELEAATERQALRERAERAELEVADLNKQLEVSRASEESARGENATLSVQQNELRRVHEALEVELAKTNATLKNANMKAFAASKQLESWRSESQRTMEQTRIEQEAALAKLTLEHAKGAEVLRQRADEATAAATALRTQLEGVTEKLSLTTKSLEALEEVERQVQGLREQAKSARRSTLDQVAQTRKWLMMGTQTPPAAVGPVPSARRAPAVPPPRPKGRGSDPPTLEIGEMEMGTDDLVMELMEARKRDGL